MVYLGVDLHRKLSHVVALDETGEVVLERRFGNEPRRPVEAGRLAGASVSGGYSLRISGSNRHASRSYHARSR